MQNTDKIFCLQTFTSNRDKHHIILENIQEIEAARL